MTPELTPQEIEQINREALSDTELVAKCSEWISKLCKSGGNAWSLRVPVDLKNDPDVLFSELINRFEASRKRVG